MDREELNIRERLEANPVIREMLLDLEQASVRRAERRAKEDPEAHRDSRVFDGPMRWRYYRAKDGRGTEVRYCYSTTPNVAGYYLVWREKHYKDKVTRDQWRSCAKRLDAKHMAHDRREAAG